MLLISEPRPETNVGFGKMRILFFVMKKTVLSISMLAALFAAGVPFAASFSQIVPGAGSSSKARTLTLSELTSNYREFFKQTGERVVALDYPTFSATGKEGMSILESFCDNIREINSEAVIILKNVPISQNRSTNVLLNTYLTQTLGVNIITVSAEAVSYGKETLTPFIQNESLLVLVNCPTRTDSLMIDSTVTTVETFNDENETQWGINFIGGFEELHVLCSYETNTVRMITLNASSTSQPTETAQELSKILNSSTGNTTLVVVEVKSENNWSVNIASCIHILSKEVSHARNTVA